MNDNKTASLGMFS